MNESLLIIDQFTFDGQGAGVFINVATEGNNRGQWIANRKIVDYPSPLDARPIERPYLGERLFIQVSYPNYINIYHGILKAIKIEFSVSVQNLDMTKEL